MSAELVYQPIQYAFLVDLLQDANAAQEIADFERMYNATASQSDVMATVTTTVNIGG